MTGYCVDANAIIQSWQVYYKQSVFPTLWSEKLPEHRDQLVFVKPIYNQIDLIRPDQRKVEISPGVYRPKTRQELDAEFPLRRKFLEPNFGDAVRDIPATVEQFAAELRMRYKTKSLGSGADVNDIYLIAYAKLLKHTVVTLEAYQPSRPPDNRIYNCKIPLICELEGVEWMTFFEMLGRLGISL